MNIGIFTDTYFPQVSGVATSIKTLKDRLVKNGHQVYIFTTTDPKVTKGSYEKNIFRFSSIPFISFSDRRIAIRGLFQAYQIAKQLNLDIVHTQTEFSMGIIGKFVARNLKIPCLHTYHTMYEDYLHYIANGKILRPIHVKEGTLAFCHHLSGVVAPSKRVLDTLTSYGVKSPIRIIPTGIDIDKYTRTNYRDLRPKYSLKPNTPVLLSISRLSYEKNIHEILDALPEILKQVPDAQLMIVGDGPYRDNLIEQVKSLNIEDHVIFVGEISNNEVNQYYHMANVFVSTSNSESQGLTYIEALASGLRVVVSKSDYTDELIDHPALGMTFSSEKEFIACVVDSLKDPRKYGTLDPQIRREKLYSISDSYFAEQIIQFYHSAQLELDSGSSSRARIDY